MMDALRLLAILTVAVLCTAACFGIQLRIGDKVALPWAVVVTACNVLVWAGLAVMCARLVP